MVGCSKSDNNVDTCDSGEDYHVTTGKALENVWVAYGPYFKDSTRANCEDYKTALKAYANVLKKYEKCWVEAGESENWKEVTQDTQKSIDDLNCQ